MTTKAELLAELKLVYTKAKEHYYRADGKKRKPLMSDAEFDAMEDRIRKLDPKWVGLKKTGTKIADKKIEAPLVEYMPSLDKMYESDVPKFYKRKILAKISTYIWMDKLDGGSLQIVYKRKNGDALLTPQRLLTRGDGTDGGDISFFIPWLIKLKRIPAFINDPYHLQYVLRIEAVMPDKVFESKWSRKRKGTLGSDNARNMVNGIFNRRDQHPALGDIKLVVLGVYGMSMAAGLRSSTFWGFDTVRYSVVRTVPTPEDHTSVLTMRRKNSTYAMDGLVIAPADWVMHYDSADKPSNLIAFKVNDEENADQVTVKKVVWQKTRLKRWIPKIQIEPTRMDGVMVTNATAHNATLMQERGIGPGAIVKVLRSGGVIPKIVGVVKTAKFEPPPGPYKVEGVHFVMLEHDKKTELEGLHHFMVSLGIETIAIKTLDKMYERGFVNIGSYVNLAVTYRTRPAVAASQFMKAGLGQVESVNKMRELSRVLNSPVPLKKLMVASGCFDLGGVGERKLTQIENGGHLDLCTLLHTHEPQVEQYLLGMKGFKEKSVATIMTGFRKFNKFLVKISKHIEVDMSKPKPKRKAALDSGLPLVGVKVAWTSYRSKDEEAKVESLGGEVVKYSASMTVVLYKTGAKFKDKIEKAGTKAMTWDEFCNRYGVGS